MANNTAVQIAPDFEQRYPNSSAKATESAMNLVFTAELLVKRITGLLQPFDLSPASGLVLSTLADSERPLSPHEIASRLIISRATVTGWFHSLKRRGYVGGEPRMDRIVACFLIEPTDTGVQVANTFRPIVHQNQKSWLAALSETEQQNLIDTLHRLQAVLIETGT